MATIISFTFKIEIAFNNSIRFFFSSFFSLPLSVSLSFFYVQTGNNQKHLHLTIAFTRRTQMRRILPHRRRYSIRSDVTFWKMHFRVTMHAYLLMAKQVSVCALANVKKLAAPCTSRRSATLKFIARFATVPRSHTLNWFEWKATAWDVNLVWLFGAAN